MPCSINSNSNSDVNQQKNKKENVIRNTRVVLQEILKAFEYFDGTNLKLNPTFLELRTKIKYKLLQLQVLSMEQSQLNRKNWLIFPNKCMLRDHVEYLESIKYLSEKNEKYQTAISLESALKLAQPNNVIFINQGDHFITSTRILKDGISLKSVSEDPAETMIGTSKKNALFEFMGKTLSIESLHLNVSIARCAVIAHCGHITLKNCIITGHEGAENAITVMPGAKVTLQNCKISGFNVGLHASSNSTLNVINCNISDVSIGMKLFDNSKVCISGCVFEKISRVCFYHETKNEDYQTGDESLFEANPSVIISGCKFKNNPTICVRANKEHIFDANM